MSDDQPSTALALLAVGVLALGGAAWLLSASPDAPDSPASPAASEAPPPAAADAGLPTATPEPGAPAAEDLPAEARRPAVGSDSPAAGRAHAREPAPKGLAALVDRGQPWSDEAMKLPKMRELDPDDPRYDPVSEAQQHFHPYEEALREAQPLDPDKWRSLLTEFKDHNAEVIARAGDLRRAGHPEDAREFMLEYARLQKHYQAQAYGRRAVAMPRGEP